MTDWLDTCRQIFERADLATRELASTTGLACPPGCGACCASPLVETTAAEVRPLAAAFAEAGMAEALLARLASQAEVGERRCALYEPDPADARRGRCGAYLHRPLVCRLFGFAARRDRNGAPELVACSVMRESLPLVVERAQSDVRAGLTAPLFGDHARAVAAERPADGALQLPINEALRLALESELLRRRFAAQARIALASSDGASSGGEGPDRGPNVPPSTPRRAA